MEKKKRIFIIDDEYKHNSFFFDKLKSVLNNYEVEFFDYNRDRNADNELKLARDIVLKRTDIDVILLDIIYEGIRLDFSMLDDISAGGGIPVIVISSDPKDDEIHEAGRRYNVLFWRKDLDKLNKLVKLIEKGSNKDSQYFRDNLLIDDKYAEVYDMEELKSAGTISAMLWENNRLFECFNTLVGTSEDKKIKVLDIGCGTGRWEEIIFSHRLYKDSVEKIIAIDYAPTMVLNAEERMNQLPEIYKSKIQIYRRTAEDLRLRDGEKDFDMVIIGFGVPSFVNLDKMIDEVGNVIKNDGLCMLTPYNYDSIYYDFIQTVSQDTQSHFTAEVDRVKNIIGPKPYEIKCIPYKREEFEGILKRRNFEILTWETFPTLYAAIGKTEIKNQTNKNKPSNISFINKKLENDQLNSGFDKNIHNLDLQLSKVLKGKGYYLNVIAKKI